MQQVSTHIQSMKSLAACLQQDIIFPDAAKGKLRSPPRFLYLLVRDLVLAPCVGRGWRSLESHGPRIPSVRNSLSVVAASKPYDDYCANS